MEMPIGCLSFLASSQQEHRQTCKVCSCPDKFDFHVSDDMWERVVPERYQNNVVCLACFDNFALERKVDYANSIEALYFAGDRAVLIFQAVSARAV